MNAWQDWPAGQDFPPQQSQEHGLQQWDLRPSQDTMTRGPASGQNWAAENNFQAMNSSSVPGLPDRTSMGRDNSSSVIAAMSDEQLYSLVQKIKHPFASSVSVPKGAQPSQPPFSVDDAKNAIRTAKASIGSKSSLKAEQANESGSEDDEKSESYAGKNKRVLANRQSAHRSRLRKLQYIQDLENNVNRIQSEISQIQPRLTFLREKYSDLAGRNHKLREKVTNLLNDARYKESINNNLRDEVKQMLADTGNNTASADQANLFALPQHSNVSYAAPLT